MGLFFALKRPELVPMKHVVDGGIAMLPERFPASVKTVESLRGQLNTLYIRWQGQEPPAFPSWCVVSWGENTGDIGKFHASENDFVTLDDDLVYPEGYIQDFVRNAKRFPGAILTHHGKTWQGPTVNYFGEVRNEVYCLHENLKEIQLTAPGTGCSFYPKEIYQRLQKEMEQDWNCGDILVGSWAKKNGVPIQAIKHRIGYFRYLRPKDTIWDQSQTRDMTALWNKYMG